MYNMLSNLHLPGYLTFNGLTLSVNDDFAFELSLSLST